MTFNAVAQILVYFALVALFTKPMGVFMAKVFTGERTWLTKPFGWLERLTYRLLGVDPEHDQKWTEYAGDVLMFSIVSMLASYAMLRLQGFLPLNSQGFGGKHMPPHLAFNTAASFTTNTNWQSYSPELAVSTFSNMV